MSFDGGSDWVEVGVTKHTVYLTLADPLTGLRQESLFNLGSRQANGMGGNVSDPSDREAITEAIWTDFGARNVRRIDGTQLTYYSSFLTQVTSTQDLLATGDGQCSSWAKLFLDVRKIQGIADIDNYVKFTPLQPNFFKGFIIADWSFTGSGQSNHQEYPYLNLPDDPFINPFFPIGYSWRYSEAHDEFGVPGQSSPKSMSFLQALGRAAVVDFDHADASGVALSREQRGVLARPQRYRYAGLRCVCRGETRGGQFRRLRRVILPVVIRGQERSVAVAQLQRWIGQSIRHSEEQSGSPQCHGPQFWSSPLLLPRMKPAITMSFPVPTRARVLILASFDRTA